MAPGQVRRFLKSVYQGKFSLKLLWIDIRYGFEEWFCKKTAKLRMKLTKKLLITSHAYYNHDYNMTWDDVEVYDQWGLWFPLGFGIVSKVNFDYDNQINRELGQPEEEWKDELHCGVDFHNDCGWCTYYFKEDYLDAQHYFKAARKHLKRELGDTFKDKELEVHLKMQSQKGINEQMLQMADWIKGGKKPLKVEFTDKAKEDFKEVLGEEEAQDLFDDIEKRNKEIDDRDNPDGTKSGN